MKFEWQKKNRYGYTVLEILVVVSIITVFLAVVFLISVAKARDLTRKVRQAEEIRMQKKVDQEEINPSQSVKSFESWLMGEKLKNLGDTNPDPLLFRVSKGVSYDSENLESVKLLVRKMMAMAILKVRSGEPQKALSLLNEALVLEPSNPVIYVELARVYLELGDSANALLQIEDSLRLEPDYADSWILRAKVRLFEGNVDLARQDLEHAVQKKQTNSEIFLVWSQYWEKKGDIEKSREYLQMFQASTGKKSP